MNRSYRWYAQELGREEIDELGFCERLDTYTNKLLKIHNQPEGEQSHYVTSGTAKVWMNLIWHLVDTCEGLREKLESERDRTEQFRWLDKEAIKDLKNSLASVREERDRLAKELYDIKHKEGVTK